MMMMMMMMILMIRMMMVMIIMIYDHEGSTESDTMLPTNAAGVGVCSSAI